MPVLGLRFPKVFEYGQLENPAVGNDNWILQFSKLGSTPYAHMTSDSLIPIAPARYSEVREVVFWLTLRVPSASTFPGRLRMAAMSSSAVAFANDPQTIAKGDYVRIDGSNKIFSNTVFHESHMFDRLGESTEGNLPGDTDQFLGQTMLLRIEFNRFNAVDDDFFEVWDSVGGEDEYIFFRPVFERTDGNFSAGGASNVVHAHNMGITVIQAPSSNNRTCTLVRMTHDLVSSSVIPTEYPTGHRAYMWRYKSEEWDNIKSINLIGWVSWASGASGRHWNQSIHKETGFEPEVFVLVAEHTFQDNIAAASTGDTAWFRSADLLADIQGAENEWLTSLSDQLSGAGNTKPAFWLEIIQEGFTKTTCYHDSGGGHIFTASAALGDVYCPEAGLFDPTWYQAFPDIRILSRNYLMLARHGGDTSDPEWKLWLDQDLQSNHKGGSSGSLVPVEPDLTATPIVEPGTKIQFQTYRTGYIDPETGETVSDPQTFTPDPIDLAGPRKLVYSVWFMSSGQAGGTGQFFYVLDVPNTEFLPAGDLFDVGAFDPEGCAATSAGLGDPGRLYISNGSTLPQKFDPDQGNITPAGMPTPFADELPSFIVTDTGLSPEGGLPDGTYIYRYTIRDCCTGKESDPNPDDIVVTFTGSSPAGKITFSFANVRVPSDNLCEICLYRTVQGGVFPVMAKVGCFDPDVTSTFEDDLADSQLDFINDPLSLLNYPMPCVPYIVAFRNRIFGAGDIPIRNPAGTVTVTNGSEIVFGSGDVQWDRCLEGRYIKLAGDCRKYEIDRVLPPEEGVSPPIGRLKLVEPYEGTNDTGVLYEICGHPNRLFWSEPLEGEYWPIINFMDIEPGDGDRIMGLATNFDRLLIYKRRKTYVMTFGELPSETNVPARISSDIGMVAPRSPAQIENGTVAMAERGLQIFDGRGVQHIPESGMVNDIFVDRDNPRYVRRDSLGRVIDAVGVFYPKREQYLLFLPTVQTVRGCNLMLVWDVKLRNITFFEFCQEFQSLVVGKDSNGDERLYAGDTNGFVWALDIGYNDGAGTPGSTGTLRGTLTGGGIDTSGVSYFEDSGASFVVGGLPALGALSGVAGLSGSLDGDTLGLAGVCVYVRAPGSEVWQQRVIFAASQKRLYLASGIEFDPTGYEYMIGAIEFEAVFKPFNYGSDDYTKRLWKHKVVHEVESYSSELEIELRIDFDDEDQFEGDVENEDGSEGRTFLMSWSKGKQVRGVERMPHTYLQVVMRNFAPDEPIRLINHVIQGVPLESR